MKILNEDWKASRDPLSRVVLTVYRYGQWAQRSWLRAVALWPYRIVHLLLVRTVIGCDISRQASIGPGLTLHHGGRGVAIHPLAVLGAGCEIYQGAAVGNRDRHGAPVLGDGVRVGAYAVIVGAVAVGAGARVGPHAVVLRDVPAKALVRSPECTVTAAP